MKIINVSGIKCECGTIIPQQYVHDNDLIMEEYGRREIRIYREDMNEAV